MKFTRESFLHEIVKPYFMGSVDKNLRSVVYDLDGHVVLCTKKFANMLGYDNWQDLCGKNILEYAKQMPQVEPDYYSNLDGIRRKVVENGVSLQYVTFLYSAEGIVSQMVYHFPIFMPTGEVVGSRVITNKFNMVDEAIYKFMEYLKRYEHKISRTHKKHALTQINFTDREYAILFLVAAGLTIDEISIFLDKPANRILHIIVHGVCKKLNLEYKELQILKKFINTHGLVHKFPKKFMKPRSIILEHGEHNALIS